MTVEASIRRGEVVPFRVLHAQRTGDPANGERAYGDAADRGLLLPISLHCAMAPDVPRLKARIDMAQIEHPWRWRRQIALDDMIELVSTHDAPGDRLAPFGGFVVDVDWSMSAGDAECVVTAAGRSHRLLADVPVYGRHMRDYDGTDRLYTGLPCSFNHGGRPNRYAGSGVSVEGFGFVPVFTYDDDPQAEYWALREIVTYLQRLYNVDETWIANFTQDDDLAGDKRPVVVNVEGLGMWAALAAACDTAGYDCWEATEADGGRPASTIAVQQRHAGELRTVKHQGVPAAGPLPLDTAATNLYAASVAESSASIVNAPVVLGGRKLFEVTVELGQAWDPLDLGIPACGVVHERIRENAAGEYCAKYVLPWASLPDSGRLWDANTDNRYAKWTLTVQDVAGAINAQWAERWPRMPYRPLPLLSGVSGAGRRIYRGVLEWKIAAGAWKKFPGGWRMLPDRIGVYITQANLADCYDPGEDGYTRNLFYLIATEVQVRMRLTCAVASPNRLCETPDRRPGSGTSFVTSSVFDLGSAGDPAAVRADGASRADEAAEYAHDPNLVRAAAAIQDGCQDRTIEAALEVPWPEPEISLGDRIECIRGIEYPLGVNAGKAARYPRVVAYTMGLEVGTYDMQLVLDTDRKAGVV